MRQTSGADLDQKVKAPSEENDKSKAHKLPVVESSSCPLELIAATLEPLVECRKRFKVYLLTGIDEVIHHLCRILIHVYTPGGFYSHSHTILLHRLAFYRLRGQI